MFKLYEVAPYFSVDYAFANLAGLCINSEVWNNLNVKTRQIIAEVAGEYVDDMLATVKDVDAAALETIRSYGVEVKVLTPEERSIWRQASQPVWDGWVQEVGPVGQQIIDIALAHNSLPELPKLLRLQSSFSADDPLMLPLENFAQAVTEGSGGSVHIAVYPISALVPHGELAEAVKQGDVEMGLLHSSLLRGPGVMDVMDGGSLPFLYNDDDGLMNAIQAGIGDLLSDELTSHNITVLDWTTTAFSHLYSRVTMLDEPSDVEGLKIRVIGGIGGAHEGIQWEATSQWGGEPIRVPYAEIYELLQKGYIDGAAHSPYNYEMMKFYEVAPYFCVDYAFANLAGLCINSDVWDSLDVDDDNTQQIIAEAAGVYVNDMLAMVKQLDAEALQRIEEDYGVEVYELSPGERLVWREASQAVWDGWLEELGDARPVGEEIIAIALPLNPLPEIP